MLLLIFLVLCGAPAWIYASLSWQQSQALKAHWAQTPTPREAASGRILPRPRQAQLDAEMQALATLGYVGEVKRHQAG